MKNNQNGFSVIEGLLILLIVAIVGFTGWFVWQSNNQASNSLKSDSSSAEFAKKATMQKEDTNTGYAVIEEWGVKVKLRDAEKVSFTTTAEGGSLPSDDEYESYATPSITPIDAKNENCKKLGLTIYRSKNQFNGETKKIGDYYYHVTGSPGQCAGDNTNEPDNLLQKRLTEDLSPANLNTR